MAKATGRPQDNGSVGDDELGEAPKIANLAKPALTVSIWGTQKRSGGVSQRRNRQGPWSGDELSGGSMGKRYDPYGSYTLSIGSPVSSSSLRVII